MIGKKNLDRIFAVFLAAVYGGLIMGGLSASWPRSNLTRYLLLSSVVCVALYFAGMWIRAKIERNRKLPTSSKELRRRTREFYSWLDSHGRR